MSENVANGPLHGISKSFRQLDRSHPEVIWVPIVVGCLALLLSVSGAYRTAELAFGHRGLLWLLVCGLIAGQFLWLARATFRAGRSRDWEAWVAAFVVTWAVTTVEIESLKYTALLPKAPDPLGDFALFMLPLLGLVCLTVYITHHLIWRSRPSPDSRGKQTVRDERGSEGREDIVMDQWPVEPVLSVNAQDHYLRVRTRLRTHFVRGRFCDALDRLDRLDGLQIHRSWWVARSEVEKVARRGRDYIIVTRDSSEIPVGRGRLNALVAAGWLSSRQARQP